ncbi:MAG: NfeD family protein [Trueperaceae bacterium]
MKRPLRMLSALWLIITIVGFSQTCVSQAQESVSENRVWVLPIEGEITTATAQFVASKVRQANEAQPLALVLYIDTPGGQIIAAEQIVNMILNNTSVPTIAVVANAISAGAIIAMSAEQVAMLPGSSIGAATAINAFTGQDAGEKVNSYWRSQFRAVAEARGRNTDVAEGMVSARIDIPGLSTAEELITLSADRAVEFDIADIKAENQGDALQQLGYGDVETTRLEPNLAERLGRWLANPIIAALLLVIGIGGIIFEALTPGFGIPGAVGVIALVLLTSGLFLATPASTFDLLLMAAGVVLLLVELFVIPGFGVAGVLGLATLVIAIVRLFPNESQWAYVLGYTTLFSVFLVAGFFYLLPRSRFTKLFALTTRLETKTTNQELPQDSPLLLGQRGTATTDLRPAGIASVGKSRVDVVTEGDFIPSGSGIEVVQVEGSRIVVRKI